MRRSLWVLVPVMMGMSECEEVPSVEVPADVVFTPGAALETLLLDDVRQDGGRDVACRLGGTAADAGQGQLLAVLETVSESDGGFVEQDAANRGGQIIAIVQWDSPEAREGFLADGSYAERFGSEASPSSALSVVPPPDLDPPAPVQFGYTFRTNRGYELGSGDPIGAPPPEFISDVLVPAATDFGRLDVYSLPGTQGTDVDFVKGFTSIVEWASEEAFIEFVTDPGSPLGQNAAARDAFVPEDSLEILTARYVANPCP
ncbi:MAG: hypothetical protein AAF602_18695 [Myxococcota bacterium]